MRHEVPYLFSGLLLHLPRNMGVGTKGEASIVVTQHAADGFHIHTVLECQGCECMSEVMKSDMLQSHILEDFLMKVYH